MPVKLAIGALVALGLAFIAAGVQKWIDGRAVSATVDAFLQAASDGDAQRALSLLTPAQRARAEARAAAGAPLFSRPDPDLVHRIRDVRVAGRQATAAVQVEKLGFVLQPKVHLQRSETGIWKIERIEDLRIDPRWSDLLKERARLEGERLAADVARALARRAEAHVERLPIP